MWCGAVRCGAVLCVRQFMYLYLFFLFALLGRVVAARPVRSVPVLGDKKVTPSIGCTRFLWQGLLCFSPVMGCLVRFP